MGLALTEKEVKEQIIKNWKGHSKEKYKHTYIMYSWDHVSALICDSNLKGLTLLGEFKFNTKFWRKANKRESIIVIFEDFKFSLRRFKSLLKCLNGNKKCTAKTTYELFTYEDPKGSIAKCLGIKNYGLIALLAPMNGKSENEYKLKDFVNNSPLEYKQQVLLRKITHTET